MRSGFWCVVCVRFGDELALSTVGLLLSLSPHSTKSPTTPTPTRPGSESPLPDRTLDCTEEIPVTAGSEWPLEPPRVAPAVRGPAVPEIPGPPQEERTRARPVLSPRTGIPSRRILRSHRKYGNTSNRGNIVRFDVSLP